MAQADNMLSTDFPKARSDSLQRAFEVLAERLVKEEVCVHDEQVAVLRPA